VDGDTMKALITAGSGFGAVLGLVVVGCSAYGVEPTTVPPLRPESSPPEGTALVCVLRGGGVGAGLTTPLRDNGVLVGATEGRSHFCYLAGAGSHTLTTEVSDADDLSFDASPGARYFFEHRIHVGQDELVRIEEAEAQRRAGSMDYVLITSGPAGEALPPEVPRVPGASTQP
jgi:hypothetical protein